MRQRTISAAVRLEMRRLARLEVRNAIIAIGIPISHVPRKEVTRLVKIFLETSEAENVRAIAERNVQAKANLT